MSALGMIEEAAANAIAPGSGFLIRLWRWIKPAMPFLIGAALVVALLIFVDHRAASHENARVSTKYQVTMNRAAVRMAKAMDALDDADRAIRTQNASIKALAKAEADRMAEARHLLALADKRDASRKAQIAELVTAAAKPIAGPPCTSLDDVRSAWK